MAKASASLAIFTFFPFHLVNLASKVDRGVFSLQCGREAPVLFGDEILNLPFPFTDDSNGNRLNPTRTQSPPDLLPEDGADLITDQTIQDPPRLLGFIF